MKTGIHRIVDPLENFKIRVTLRETSGNVFASKESRKEYVPYEIKSIVSWQQKIFGPRDILDYIRNKRSNVGLQAQLDNRRYLSNYEKGGKKVTDLLDKTMIYTYIDEEPYLPSYNPITTETDTESYLSSAFDSKILENQLNDRQLKAADRIHREKDIKVMHICFVTDLDVAALSNANFWSSPSIEEHTLCSVYLSKDGLLEVRPSFSEILPEAEYTTVDDAVPPTIFLDDHTVNASAQHGFKLLTYRVRTSKGVEYEYALENMNDVLSPLELQDVTQAAQRADAEAAAVSRGILGELTDDQDAYWKQQAPPEPFSHTCDIYGEIQHARGFSDEYPVYVKYQVVPPFGWQIDAQKENTVEKYTEQDLLLPADDYIGYTARAVPNFQPSEQVEYITRNGKQIKVKVPVAPSFGRHLQFITKVFIAAVYMFCTLMAIIFGLGYPFWIVPAIVIICVLGYGTPSTGTQIVIQGNSESSNSFDKARSIVGDMIVDSQAVFGHTFNLKFNISDKALKEGSPSSTKVTIFFQVYSVNWFGLHSLEGCGYTHVENKGGQYASTISTWKPVGSLQSRLAAHFIGTSAQLTNVAVMEVPNKFASSISKFGVQTENSGVIAFCCNVITYDPRRKQKYQPKVVEQTTVRRTVDDILSTYRSTDTLGRSLNRSISKSQVFGVPPSPKAVVLPSDAKIASILARVRAKQSSLSTVAEVTPAKPSRQPSPSSVRSASRGREAREAREDMNSPEPGATPTTSGSLVDRFERAGITEGSSRGVASRDRDEVGRSDVAPPRREVRRNLASAMRGGNKYDSESEESKPLLSDDESEGGRKELPPLRKRRS